MKIRILDDSIRLRLDRDEVAQIGAGRPVIGQTRFPAGGVFDYVLRPGGDQSMAGFDATGITVTLPSRRLADWADIEQDVTIREQLPLVEGALTILVEKDFECLEPRAGESQANRFANPKALP